MSGLFGSLGGSSVAQMKTMMMSMVFEELKPENIKLRNKTDTIKTGIQSVLDSDAFKNNVPDEVKKTLMTKLQEIGKLKPSGSSSMFSLIGGKGGCRAGKCQDGGSKKRSNKIRKSKKSKKSRSLKSLKSLESLESLESLKVIIFS